MEQLELFPDCAWQLSLEGLDQIRRSTGLAESARSSMLVRQLHSVEVSAYNCRCPRCKQSPLVLPVSQETGWTQKATQQAVDCSVWIGQQQNAYPLPPGTKPGQVVLQDPYGRRLWWESRQGLNMLLACSLLIAALAASVWIILR